MIDVVAATDLHEGVVLGVQVGDRPVGLVLWKGTVYAFADRCPHMGASLCHGRAVRRPRAEGPEGRLAPGDGLTLTCPWHGWEFDVRTGRHVADPRRRVRCYPVEVRDGRVLVDVRGRAAWPRCR